MQVQLWDVKRSLQRSLLSTKRSDQSNYQVPCRHLFGHLGRRAGPHEVRLSFFILKSSYFEHINVIQAFSQVDIHFSLQLSWKWQKPWYQEQHHKVTMGSLCMYLINCPATSSNNLGFRCGDLLVAYNLKLNLRIAVASVYDSDATICGYWNSDLKYASAGWELKLMKDRRGLRGSVIGNCIGSFKSPEKYSDFVRTRLRQLWCR